MVARDRLEGVGAVASSRAAEIYNLEILAEGIQVRSLLHALQRLEGPTCKYHSMRGTKVQTCKEASCLRGLCAPAANGGCLVSRTRGCVHIHFRTMRTMSRASWFSPESPFFPQTTSPSRRVQLKPA